MAWLVLFVAGLFECAWAVGLRYTEGFSRPLPILFVLATMGISLWLLAVAMRSIEVGTAYAVWTGIGAVGVAILGMLLFDESREIARLASIALIVAGVVGLRIFAAPGSA